MSNVDRIIRVVLALVFAWLYFGGIVPGTFGVVLVILGVINVLTALIGHCPLYVPFKISTYK
jgi:hypothetical protein